jgi:multisite-specific tRNA:(cytosine-C5)-methyltransferase
VPRVRLLVFYRLKFKTLIAPLGRERKREAEEVASVDGTKRPRLQVDYDEMKDLSTSGEVASAGMDVDISEEKVDKSYTQQPSSGPSKGKSRLPIKPSGPDGAFKENPYTYVSEDDPVLLSCM